ncbi:MAG: GNAT family protein [Parvularculaceae bacterium]|nr:GNAT family protein [Parvularculaceae bacterium]
MGAPALRLDPVILENAFVRLEPVKEAHRDPLRAAGADPDLWRYSVLNQHGAGFDAWFDHQLSRTTSGADLCFAVIDKASGEAAGSSSYLAIVPEHKRLEIGWTWYDRRFWAGATNPSCKRLLMGHAFEALGFNRVELKLDATNQRSWNAVERLGAKYEGIFRQHMVMPDGRLRDTAYFSVIAPEWPMVKAGLDRRLAGFEPSGC